MSLLERCPQFRGVLIEGFHCIYRIALCSVKPRRARAGKGVYILCVYVSSPLHWSTGLCDHLFKRVDRLGRCARHVRFIVVCE